MTPHLTPTTLRVERKIETQSYARFGRGSPLARMPRRDLINVEAVLVDTGPHAIPKVGDTVTIAAGNGSVVPVLVTSVRISIAPAGTEVHLEGTSDLGLVDRTDEVSFDIDPDRVDLLEWRDDLSEPEP